MCIYIYIERERCITYIYIYIYIHVCIVTGLSLRSPGRPRAGLALGHRLAVPAVHAEAHQLDGLGEQEGAWRRVATRGVAANVRRDNPNMQRLD